MKKWTLLCLLLGLCILISGCFGGVNKGKLRKEMKAYLEAEHGQEAVVEKPEAMGNEAFGYSSYSAEAYLVNDPEVKFDVAYYVATKEFSDGYHSVRIENQAKKVLVEAIKNIYGKQNFIAGDVALYYPRGMVLTADMSYESILRDFPGQLRIGVSAFTASETFNEAEAIEKIRVLVNDILLASGYEHYDYFHCFVTPEHRKTYEPFGGDKPYNVPDNPFEMGYIKAIFSYDTRDGVPFEDDLKSRFRYSD